MNRILCLLFGLMLLVQPLLHAQPYSLKKDFKPVKLELLKDTRKGHEGEKSITYVGKVADSASFHYIKGYDMYQKVDILVANYESDESLTVSLITDTWDEVVATQNTGSSKDGIVNFKLQDHGAIGIKIDPPSSGAAKYVIVVLASPPKQEHLGSPFVPIEKSQMKVSGSESGDDGGGSNLILYLIIGIALLVIAFLGGKLLGKKKAANFFILMLFTSISVSAQMGTTGIPEGSLDIMESQQQQDSNDNQARRDFRSNTTQNIVTRLIEIRSTWNEIRSFDRSYTTYRNCVPTGIAPDDPRIPSFCTESSTETGTYDSSNCAGCFGNSRRDFNEARYKLEMLAGIYKCAKTYSNAAIALGDNTSGIHAVTGIVWQQERAKIMKDVQKMEEEYDKTYSYLMQELRDSMMELNLCEEQYGVEDWFDRFGFMYFEFMQEKYRRVN
ncbi:hypothetical protein ATE92_0962 [Ulvibacter sp. MAR_2010_11]|uniref:hypothetical protein n=1 Tax=Ulvibacter sp. MAR_2010_11 TaxID=1250229 RepID=UPI000CAAD917|nr:hypothetical protein [Ulvibacter sp. MAR_2010_11]PKA82823.1 hypothetical protein ATE92_0962 [Ulvibacter sp. MAR_2010_11]